MEYGLIPTEAALSFLLILILVYSKKEQFKNTRTKTYKNFLLLTLLHGVVVFISIVAVKYFGENILTKLLWRLAAITMIDAWGVYYLYGIITLNDIQEQNLMKMMFLRCETIVILIILAFSTFGLLLPINIPVIDFVDPNNIYYFSKGAALLMFLGTLGANLLYSIGFIKNRNKVSRDFKFSNILSLVVSLICCGIQYYIPEFDWVPLAYTVIAYITYFMVENPDIMLLKETKKLQQEIDGKGKSKTEFLANLNEEINVPINKMLELCEDMSKSEEFNIEEVKKDLALLTNEGKSVLETMNNILDASQIKSNKTFVDNRRYTVKKLIRDIINFTQEKLEGKNVKLVMNVNTSLSSKLYGDEEKIYQSITNIISAACANTKVGRITISVSSTRVENTETVTFKITDTGEGIKEVDQPKVFDEDSGGFHGHVVAKKYVDMMGGKIWFESRYKMGTKFYVQYSQKIADSSPIGDLSDINKEVAINSTNVDYSKYKILLVDDSISNTKLTKKLLKEKNFAVEVITNGEECVKKIKAEEQIDAIFMDIMMPDMDGVETLKVLKDLEGYTLPPIVALTANALSGMKETYLSEGFDDYISKPIDQKELDKVIKKLFNKQT